MIRRWVGREGFCYHFGKLHVSVSAVGDRSISCWEDDGIKRPLFTRWSRPQTLEKMPALIPLVILLGGLDGDKEKEVVQDRCHQESRWSQLLIYNLQVLYSGKRCVSVIDVSSCYLPPDIEDSPVSGGAGEEEDFRSKIFFDITSFFSPHGIILSCGLR